MAKEKNSGMGFLLYLAGPRNRAYLVFAALFSVLSALCSFIPYVMVYEVLMLLFESKVDGGGIISYGLIAAVAIVAKFLFSIVSGTFSHIGAFNTLYTVRKDISAHIGRVNLGFFSSRTTGEIKKVIIEDVERIEKFLAHQIPDLVSAVCAPLIIFVYLLTLNVPMALCVLVPVVLGLVIQMIATVTAGRKMETYHALVEKMNATILQFINGMPVMKTFNLTSREYKDYSDTVTEYNAFWKWSTKSQGYTYGIFVALVESGILFVLPVGGFLFLSGDLVIGTYLFFMIMSMVFLSSLLNLINFSLMFSQIMSGVGRIKNILDIPAICEGSAVLQAASDHAVCFENVGFSYDKTEVLHGMDLKLPAGSLTAFVGPSGAGKTTAAQLIPKFWEVTSGKITIAGIDINEYTNESLMDAVAFVFQETFLLNDTLYENIAIGSKHADHEKVIEAARAAQIHDFIMSLPDAYETRVGEGGIKLSGGEKQRVCIARAILKDAPIVIFDEATSYADIENEHKIQQALSTLLSGKTTIMIAHRLHTIVNADCICVFSKGHLVEQGTHAELTGRESLYHRMWETYAPSSVGGAS